MNYFPVCGIPPLHREFHLPLHYSRKTVLKAIHGLSPWFSLPTCLTACAPFTPSNSGQRLHPTFYRCLLYTSSVAAPFCRAAPCCLAACSFIDPDPWPAGGVADGSAVFPPVGGGRCPTPAGGRSPVHRKNQWCDRRGDGSPDRRFHRAADHLRYPMLISFMAGPHSMF